MSVKSMLMGIGMSKKKARKMNKDVKKLRKDLAKHYGCSLQEAQERFLRVEGKL